MYGVLQYFDTVLLKEVLFYLASTQYTFPKREILRKILMQWCEGLMHYCCTQETQKPTKT